jgi:hypothetical protein
MAAPYLVSGSGMEPTVGCVDAAGNFVSINASGPGGDWCRKFAGGMVGGNRPSLGGGGAIGRFLNGGKSTYRGFMTSPDANMKNNAIFAISAVLGAVATRKFIKKGDKDLNTVLGGVGGLLLGVGVSKLIK